MAISTVLFLLAMLTSLNLNLPFVEMLLFEEEPSAEDSLVPTNEWVGPDPGYMVRVTLAPEIYKSVKILASFVVPARKENPNRAEKEGSCR